MAGSLNIDAAYDAREQLTNVDDWDNAATTVTYMQVGQRKTVARPNDVITTAAYDLAGRLTDANQIANSGYTYDPRGKRRQKRNLATFQ